MKRRKWDSQTKARIVIAGLGGDCIADLCRKHEIKPGQYYKWRDQFLANSQRAFESPDGRGDLQDLEAENEKLKRLVGELTYRLQTDERT